MKISALLILTTLFVWSCFEKTQRNEASNQEVIPDEFHELNKHSPNSITKKESKNIELTEDTISNTPCIEIREFVVDIEILGWIPDTNRLNKRRLYKELNRESVNYFNGRPFYPIGFQDSKLNKAYKSEIFRSHLGSFSFELFEGVRSIWGYFYRKKGATSLIVDGVIEQWEFESETLAEKALEEIMQYGEFFYFNTTPFFCRIANKLIIFQTRAMAFSFDQKYIFEKFVEEKEPNTLYAK